MNTAGGIAACCWMLLKVTVPPGDTGFGDASAVIVIGIRLACVGIRLLTQALSKVTALAWLVGSKKMLAATANAPSTAVLRRLLIAPPLFAIPFALPPISQSLPSSETPWGCGEAMVDQGLTHLKNDAFIERGIHIPAAE